MNQHFLSPYKALYHLESVRQKKIVFARWDITNRCNLNCAYCHSKNMNKDEWELTSALGLIHDIKEMAIPAIELAGGGEPLYHREFRQIIHHIKNSGIRIGLITNGTFIAGYIDMLLLCDWIRVSIHPNAIRMGEKGTYLKMLRRNVPTIRDSGIVIGASIVVTNENYMTIDRTIDEIASCGFQYCWIGYDDQDCRDNIATEIKQRIVEILSKKPAEHASSDCLIIPNYARLYPKSQKKTYSHCYYSDIVISISADGKVYPCCQLKNIGQQAIGDIAVSPLPSLISNRGNVDISRCPNCVMDTKNEFMEYILSDAIHKEFV